MRRPIRLAAILLALSVPALAQTDPPVRIGVALSGGSAKGFAHIGVLRVLESVVLSASQSHWLRFGSVTSVDLRLGEQLHLGVQHLNRAALGSRLLAGVDASYSRTPIDVYEGRRRVAEVRTGLLGLSGFVGTRLGDSTVARLQVKGEHVIATRSLRRVTVRARAVAGASAGPDLPFHYRFFLAIAGRSPRHLSGVEVNLGYRF